MKEMRRTDRLLLGVFIWRWKIYRKCWPKSNDR